MDVVKHQSCLLDVKECTGSLSGVFGCLFVSVHVLLYFVDFWWRVCLDSLSRLPSSPSSGLHELKTPAGGHTFVAMATFVGVIYFSWEHLMEATRGAVKNRFSFVSPLSASVTVTEKQHCHCEVTTVPEHFV